MKSMTDIISAFTKGIARSRVSLIGAMIVTITFPFLLGAVVYDMIWHIANTYFAAVIYMVLGPAFIAGLVLVFLGLFFFKGKEEVRLFTMEYLRDFFTDPTKFSKMRKLVFFAVFLTCINLFVMGLLAYRGYHYMESVGFCGQFCHTVMNPEFTAYNNSPHSRVPCVECHIGAGATWFVKSKISGARQLFAVAFDTYSKPIETPVHGLRPARETCEECHRPEKFHGEKLVVRDHFAEDEQNTHSQSVLLMKIGSAGDRTTSPHGIHWHIAPENKVVYKAASWDRKVIPEVTLIRADGTKVVYKSTAAAEEGKGEKKGAGHAVEPREMDCIDCHNRPTHIYQTADRAVDTKILDGKIPRDLPFIKKMAMEVIQKEYKSQDEARAAIASALNAYYQKNHPELVKQNPALLAKAISGVQAAYSQNVFPEMNIKWGQYMDHIGHGPNFDIGCFRCHDGNHESESGEVISADCDTCHTVLAENETDPAILKTLRGQAAEAGKE